MSETIVDPYTGKALRIDDEGRAVIRADMVPHPQHHSMTHKNLFLLEFCAKLSSASEESLGIFKNLDTDIDFEFYVTQINSNANVTVIPYFDQDYDSGGVVVTPRNMNRGSGLTLPTTTALIREGGDSSNLSLTGGFAWGPKLYVAGYDAREINFQGGLILTNNTSISFGVIGAPTMEVCMLMLCSYHAAGTQL